MIRQSSNKVNISFLSFMLFEIPLTSFCEVYLLNVLVDINLDNDWRNAKGTKGFEILDTKYGSCLTEKLPFAIEEWRQNWLVLYPARCQSSSSVYLSHKLASCNLFFPFNLSRCCLFYVRELKRKMNVQRVFIIHGF